MATVNKNFRIKNGLVVEGSTATVNGNNVLVENASDQYILNLIGGETLVKSVESTQLEVDGNGKLSVKANVFDAYGAASTAQSNAETYAATVANNAQSNAEDYADSVAGTAQVNAQNYADGLATNYDAAGSASTAETNANTYTNNAINALDTDDIEEGLTNLYFTNQRALDATSAAYDAAGAAASALADAESFTTAAINVLDTDDIEEGSSNLYFTDTRARGALSASLGISYNSGTGAFTLDDNYAATKYYVDTAINNLVDGAPGLLNTLNEIAAAINDDANYFTTIANQIASKQNNLTAGDFIDITNDVISVTGLSTDNVSEGSNLYFTDARARDAVDGTDRSFTSVEINEISKEVAATINIPNSGVETTAYSWPKADYRSAKFMVKIKNHPNTEVSEVLITLDAGDNVYLTEYGMSSTSGSSLGWITADVSGNDVRLRIQAANSSSEAMVAGTLLK